MSSKRAFRLLLALLSIAIVALSLSGITSAVNLGIGTPVKLHSLTGLEGVDGPVMMVKIDDTTLAHPQVGLRSADVVYIEQVEGGLTRLAALFSSDIPEIVGPVRSARISDIELAAQYGKVIFAYSGAQRKMLPVIAAANFLDGGATHFGPTYYENAPNRIAPYAMMLKAKLLKEKIISSGSDVAISKNMGWNFGEAPLTLKPINGAHISWPASSYDLHWSSKDERWLLDHNGSPDVDETGYQLGPPTFVVQIVSITDSIYKDKVGGVTPLSKTVGSGECLIFRNGGVQRALWNRASEESGTSFTNAEGEEITFDNGQIWFALTSKAPVIEELSPKGAANSPSK